MIKMVAILLLVDLMLVLLLVVAWTMPMDMVPLQGIRRTRPASEVGPWRSPAAGEVGPHEVG